MYCQSGQGVVWPSLKLRHLWRATGNIRKVWSLKKKGGGVVYLVRNSRYFRSAYVTLLYCDKIGVTLPWRLDFIYGNPPKVCILPVSGRRPLLGDKFWFLVLIHPGFFLRSLHPDPPATDTPCIHEPTRRQTNGYVYHQRHMFLHLVSALTLPPSHWSVTGEERFFFISDQSFSNSARPGPNIRLFTLQLSFVICPGLKV